MISVSDFETKVVCPPSILGLLTPESKINDFIEKYTQDVPEKKKISIKDFSKKCLLPILGAFMLGCSSVMDAPPKYVGTPLYLNSVKTKGTECINLVIGYKNIESIIITYKDASNFYLEIRQTGFNNRFEFTLKDKNSQTYYVREIDATQIIKDLGKKPSPPGNRYKGDMIIDVGTPILDKDNKYKVQPTKFVGTIAFVENDVSNYISLNISDITCSFKER